MPMPRGRDGNDTREPRRFLSARGFGSSDPLYRECFTGGYQAGRASPSLSSKRFDCSGAAGRQRCLAYRRTRFEKATSVMDWNRNSSAASCAECVADQSASRGFANEAKPVESVRWSHDSLLLRVSDSCSASASSSSYARLYDTHRHRFLAVINRER